MDHFDYRDGELHAEDRPLSRLAEAYGTPLYVYSRATLERHWRAFDDALTHRRHLVCYAVKANSSLAVLNLLARLGSGFDIVSGGELERVLEAGGDPSRVVFSGVGKQRAEIHRALSVGIRCFNVESAAELERINAIAIDLDVAAPVSVRVNPDVDADTHPYIATGLAENKFGVAIDDAVDLYRRAAELSGIHVEGVDCHIGSQLTDTAPFTAALERVLALVDRLAEEGIPIRHLDVGGGVGIRYADETPPTPAEYVAALDAALGERDLELLVEPGRAIAGNAGVLLTRVEYLKPGAARNFAIVDAAMNDLMRPALYNAWQAIEPVRPRTDIPAMVWEIVGPVCETGDWLGRDRHLALAPDDLLAVRSAGAYGFTMASNYNSRARPAEVMVDGEHDHLIRARERTIDLYRHEHLLPRDATDGNP
ncbi:MAG: diaminopimelate decarboxylase [Pseudomonadota bacterium]